jgi:hypothetical protein
MRHLPPHVRERLESQHPQFAPYMLPEEKAVCVCGVGGCGDEGRRLWREGAMPAYYTGFV